MRQDYSHFEIIVVDDGFDDDTGKNMIDHFGLCLIETIDNQCVLKHKPIIQIWNKICNGIYLYLVQKENGGKGDALNAGIGFCHGDYFACIDADCTFSTDTLSRLTKALRKEKNIVAVGGRVLPITGLVVTDEHTGAYYKDKAIMITGGGGSIGSELCRQLAKMSPKQLIILDIYENGAYDVQQELKIQYGKALDVQIVIVSVCNRVDWKELFKSIIRRSS